VVHFGHFTDFPANSSLARPDQAHFGHLTPIDMWLPSTRNVSPSGEVYRSLP